MAGDDDRQAGRGERLEPRVVELDVAEQEAVHAPRGGEPLVGAEVDALGHAQHEVVVVVRASVRSMPARKRTKNGSTSSWSTDRTSSSPIARARAWVSARA